jgi:hypothetical protein
MTPYLTQPSSPFTSSKSYSIPIVLYTVIAYGVGYT